MFVLPVTFIDAQIMSFNFQIYMYGYNRDILCNLKSHPFSYYTDISPQICTIQQVSILSKNVLNFSKHLIHLTTGSDIGNKFSANEKITT